MGVYVIQTEDTAEDADIGVVIEGTTVVSNLRSVADGICTLFGLIYILNLQYPKSYNNTFEVIQKIFMDLDNDDRKISPKVHSLKNKLLA